MRESLCKVHTNYLSFGVVSMQSKEYELGIHSICFVDRLHQIKGKMYSTPLTGHQYHGYFQNFKQQPSQFQSLYTSMETPLSNPA